MSMGMGRRGGHLRVNGSPIGTAHLRRLCGYVTQRDVLFPLLTVRETLHFIARIRVGLAAYDPAVVDALVSDLALARVADTRVKDLSGGVRRRVSIDVEAVHDPAVLILDEPTSGLDSASALQIVAALRAMASGSRTVVLSIHQPGARNVKMFAAVLLLAAGSVLHHSTVDALTALLADAGLRLPPHVDVVEFAILSQRFFKNVVRTRQLFACRTVCMLLAGLALSSIFYDLADDKVAERVGLFAFLLTFLLSSTTEALPVFVQEREILAKETSSGRTGYPSTPWRTPRDQ